MNALAKPWNLLTRLEKAAVVRTLVLELGPKASISSDKVIAAGAKMGIHIKRQQVWEARVALGFKKPKGKLRRKVPLDEWRAHFGRRLKEIRAAKGITLRSLAAATKMEYSSINQIELGGTEPMLHTARLLAAALDVSLEELAGPLPPVRPL
jgi:ribosome-binding protein aMBF1 (putative translation factor)